MFESNLHYDYSINQVKGSQKMEDLKINPINLVTPISPKGGGGNIFKPITRNVLYYAQDVKFWISES